MKSSSDPSVLLIAIGARPAPELLRIALRQAWSVREMDSAAAALEGVLEHRPAVLVLQVAPASGETIELIRLVRCGPQPMPLVAVGMMHQDQIERAVRVAGVDCYVPGTADTALIEDTVAALLQRKDRSASGASLRRPAARQVRNRSLSHSLLLPTDMGGGRYLPAAHLLGPRGRVRSRKSTKKLSSDSADSTVGNSLQQGGAC